MDVRRGAAKLPHAVSLARFGRLRSVTFRHEQYISSIPTGEASSGSVVMGQDYVPFSEMLGLWARVKHGQHMPSGCKVSSCSGLLTGRLYSLGLGVLADVGRPLLSQSPFMRQVSCSKP